MSAGQKETIQLEMGGADTHYVEPTERNVEKRIQGAKRERVRKQAIHVRLQQCVQYVHTANPHNWSAPLYERHGSFMREYLESEVWFPLRQRQFKNSC